MSHTMNPSRDLPVLFLISLILSGFWYIGSAITGLLLLVVAVIGCRSVFKRQAWQVYSLSKLMLIYLVWLFVVALNSTVPNTSMMTLAILAGLPVMYLVGTNTPNFSDIWKKLRIFFFIMGVGLAAWAIWQVFNQVGYGHAVGPLVDRNAFAALMNLLWFPAAYLLLVSKSTASSWKPMLVGGGLFVISLALFATASRGGVVTWLLLLPILLWAGYRHTQSKRLVAIIPIIALLAYICSALLLHSSVGDRTFQLTQDASTTARLLMWKSTVQMTLAHPFIGTGWGTFVNYYPAYRSPLENTTTGFFAHNDYLQLAAEGGMPTLLLLIGVLFGLLLQLKRCLYGSEKSTDLERSALLLGVLALFMQAVVNFIFCFAFMNLLAGLYLARIAQLNELALTITIPSFEHIRPSVKRVLASFIVLILAAPFAIHLVAATCLVGNKPGLKAINWLAPNLTDDDVARVISSVYPKNEIAQEYLLLTAESLLANKAVDAKDSNDVRREFFNQAIARFDFVRAQSANSPDVGVREVKLLVAHHLIYDVDISDSNSAYIKAHEVLSDNLKANAYHTDSIIMLARLQVIEGQRLDAIKTLQYAASVAMRQLDHRLIYIEILRQRIAPRVVDELDYLEGKLRHARNSQVFGQPNLLPANFGKEIDVRLNLLSKD